MKFVGVSLSDPIYDEIYNKILESYPNACILYIDEVYNETMLKGFNDRKNHLVGLPRVLRLFHGTKHDNIQSIADNGFMKEYNKVSAYGIGTYFSTRAEYSKNYANVDKDGISYMFYCDVLIGNCIPCGTNMEIDTSKYDTSVNSLQDTSIYVTPYNDGAYPRYMVAFYKGS